MNQPAPRKVLVIDDSLSVRKAIERMLLPLGYEVTCGKSGAEALEKAAAVAPDVVICDFVLPDLDGFEVCRRIGELPSLSEVPFLFISGTVDAEANRQAAAVGVEVVLKKPFAVDELIYALERLLGAEGAVETASAPEPVVPPQLLERLDALRSLDGCRFAGLIEQSGNVLGCHGDWSLAADHVATRLPALLAVAAGATQELGTGALRCLIFEASDGTLLVQPVSLTITLLLGMLPSASLGRARLAMAQFRKAYAAAVDAPPAAERPHHQTALIHFPGRA